jgi:hypothetical protein
MRCAGMGGRWKKAMYLGLSVSLASYSTRRIFEMDSGAGWRVFGKDEPQRWKNSKRFETRGTCSLSS